VISVCTLQMLTIKELQYRYNNYSFKCILVEDKTMHWSSGGSTRDIETTAYALLFYAERKDAGKGLKIVTWLVEQRNPNGGFGSTQVCFNVVCINYG